MGEQLTFDEMMMISTLLDFHDASSLKSLWVDILVHSDILSWMRDNQSLFSYSLAEKQQIPITQYLIWLDYDSNLQSTTLN